MPLPSPALLALLWGLHAAWGGPAETAETPAETQAETPTESAETPPPSQLRAGDIFEVRTLVPVSPRDLRLSGCTDAFPMPYRGPDAARDNALVMRVTVRRGRARLVTVAEVQPGLEALAPCLEREIARVDWGLRKGELRVPFHLVLPGTPGAALPRPMPKAPVLSSEPQPPPAEPAP